MYILHLLYPSSELWIMSYKTELFSVPYSNANPIAIANLIFTFPQTIKPNCLTKFKPKPLIDSH